jgi:hypothetical protein
MSQVTPFGRFKADYAAKACAVCATVLICALVLPGRTQQKGPAINHAQRFDPCGWMGVQVRPMLARFVAFVRAAQDRKSGQSHRPQRELPSVQGEQRGAHR